jgi:hypothetical protein
MLLTGAAVLAIVVGGIWLIPAGAAIPHP